jgi:hypothetical protein
MTDLEKIRSTLAKIAALAASVAGGDESTDGELEDEPEAIPAPVKGKLVCTPKSLPKNLLHKAAKTAVEHNPVNQPALAQLSTVAPDMEITPAFIAVLTTKYWGPSQRRLTVSFMDNPPSDLRRRILSHMNAWNRTVGITFVETGGTGQVRISRGPGGYYSYLGTDILHIPSNRQTMNLQGFTMNTLESEFKRVIRHETGHTLGCPHEHMRQALVDRIDREKAYEYFWRTQRWDRATVDLQVLTPLDEQSLMATPADQTSIMCYQLPGSITIDGRPILGGVDINATDYAFMGRIYPKPGHAEGDFEEEAWEGDELSGDTVAASAR